MLCLLYAGFFVPELDWSFSAPIFVSDLELELLGSTFLSELEVEPQSSGGQIGGGSKSEPIVYLCLAQSKLYFKQKFAQGKAQIITKEPHKNY